MDQTFRKIALADPTVNTGRPRPSDGWLTPEASWHNGILHPIPQDRQARRHAFIAAALFATGIALWTISHDVRGPSPPLVISQQSTAPTAETRPAAIAHSPALDIVSRPVQDFTVMDHTATDDLVPFHPFGSEPPAVAAPLAPVLPSVKGRNVAQAPQSNDGSSPPTPSNPIVTEPEFAPRVARRLQIVDFSVLHFGAPDGSILLGATMGNSRGGGIANVGSQHRFTAYSDEAATAHFKQVVGNALSQHDASPAMTFAPHNALAEETERRASAAMLAQQILVRARAPVTAHPNAPAMIPSITPVNDTQNSPCTLCNEADRPPVGPVNGKKMSNNDNALEFDSLGTCRNQNIYNVTNHSDSFITGFGSGDRNYVLPLAPNETKEIALDAGP